LGTPQVMTDKNHNIRWSAQYYPFGALASENVSVQNNLHFPGQYHDRSINLYYNMFRTYQPTLGRYLTPDPIGIAGGIDLYGYAGQNPINYSDPTALSPSFGDCLLKCADKQLGISALLGATGVLSGLEVIPVSGKLGGATKGTSIASKYLSKWLPQRIPSLWAPTWKHPFVATKILGRFIGRWIPVIGWGVLAYDAISTGLCVNRCMNEQECK
jgi:RHS repeat-associated protein